MQVYKFGGGVLRDAQGVKQLHSIVSQSSEPIVIVVSAMAKTTNMLEDVVNSFFYKKSDLHDNVTKVAEFHHNVVNDLFEDISSVLPKVDKWLSYLDNIVFENDPSMSYNFEYDKIVSIGEILSSTIVAEYLNACGTTAKWVDVRNFLKSDDNYKDANIDFALSEELFSKNFDTSVTSVTQGFIAGTKTNHTTTIGREGSDYSAALLANLLNASSVTLWKDVSGVMSADPKKYSDVKLLEKLSYRETIELSYCGASILHPKAVKPLENKKIPLHIKSIYAPNSSGTIVEEVNHKLELPPIFIEKKNQVLLTLTPRDFSFIAEERLSHILSVLASYRISVSLIQTSAISFSLCMDYNSIVFNQLIDVLKDEYQVLYNTDVDLITIRHYTQDAIEKFTQDRVVFVEQRSRLTIRMVLNSVND